MISIQIDEAIFEYRVAGIAISNGKVLLHKALSDDFWSLPGGRAELFEFSKDTLVREMKEETGLSINVGSLIWLSENMFQYHGTRHHAIGLYYTMEIIDNQINDIFWGIEDRHEILFQWYSLDDLQNINLYPKFLITELPKCPLIPNHFICDFQDLSPR